MLRGEEIIYVGNDWFADNRTSSHQIARRLARHNRLLYVEAAGQRAPKATRRDLGKIVRKLRKAWSNPVAVASDGAGTEGSMHLYSPLILPFHRFAAVRRLNRWLLGRSVRRACRKVGFSNPILWIILPHYASLVATIARKGTVYYVVDEYASLPDVDPERIRAMEREVLASADVVFTVSQELTERKRKLNDHTYFSPHGVDTAHFRRAAETDTPVAPELRSLPHPVIGFFGLIEQWIDLELVRHAALERPAYSFVLIGRVARDVSAVSRLPNVHLLGQRPYEQIPEYLKGFDVCLIPFELNDVIINSNPLKLKEYLAGGKPVVSVAIREVAAYGDLVYTSKDRDDFVRCIDRALAEDSEEKRRARVHAMESESWEAKVDTICERVGQHIAGVKNE